MGTTVQGAKTIPTTAPRDGGINEGPGGTETPTTGTGGCIGGGTETPTTGTGGWTDTPTTGAGGGIGGATTGTGGGIGGGTETVTEAVIGGWYGGGKGSVW